MFELVTPQGVNSHVSSSSGRANRGTKPSCHVPRNECQQRVNKTQQEDNYLCLPPHCWKRCEESGEEGSCTECLMSICRAACLLQHIGMTWLLTWIRNVFECYSLWLISLKQPKCRSCSSEDSFRCLLEFLFTVLEVLCAYWVLKIPGDSGPKKLSVVCFVFSDNELACVFRRKVHSSCEG